MGEHLTFATKNTAMNDNETSPVAIASLAFSCLGAVTMGILAIPGIVCGCIAKKQAQRGEYGGQSLAQAGIIVGSAVLILWILIPALVFGGFGFVVIAVKEPWIAGGVFAVMLLLALLPLAFTSMATRRDSRSLRRLVERNQSRL